MTRLLLILSVVAVSLLLAAPAFASDDHTCDHNGATIESLRHCVMHAHEAGHITSQGVADSLLAKVDAAQAAQDRGDIRGPINQLRAIINEVNAQAGKSIEGEHASHLVEHAQNVIAALGG